MDQYANGLQSKDAINAMSASLPSASQQSLTEYPINDNTFYSLNPAPRPHSNTPTTPQEKLATSTVYTTASGKKYRVTNVSQEIPMVSNWLRNDQMSSARQASQVYAQQFPNGGGPETSVHPDDFTSSVPNTRYSYPWNPALQYIGQTMESANRNYQVENIPDPSNTSGTWITPPIPRVHIDAGTDANRDEVINDFKSRPESQGIGHYIYGQSGEFSPPQQNQPSTSMTTPATQGINGALLQNSGPISQSSPGTVNGNLA
jgi:hypothetical protein